MQQFETKTGFDIADHLATPIFEERRDLFSYAVPQDQTTVEFTKIGETTYPRFINEFWTSKQRQACSLHEIAYRACFKPQLPRFFIQLLTSENEIVYDPFSGRGTTVIEAALLGRNIISNDVNPLSKILTAARLHIPNISDLQKRLAEIPIDSEAQADIDLSMFFHPQTLREILSLREYLSIKNQIGEEDDLDSWIRMVATNRLTGHSTGFFSVYTLPPNQAVSTESQKKINIKRNQTPEYRDTKSLILKKSRDLIRNVTEQQIENLERISRNALFFSTDARFTREIPDDLVQLTVTSPPFLDVVQYSQDNWLRCWFNRVDTGQVAKELTMAKAISDWSSVMRGVLTELYRITRPDGWVTFEVGEVRNGRINLDDYVVPLGLEAGFRCEGVLINTQEFTKTANIWGIQNNKRGTNTNRIVIFHKFK